MNDPNRTGPHQPDTSDEVATDQPQRIGRYRIERILGRGGFGLVYLAYDEQLQRHVAVKVPHRSLISRPEDAEAYRTEARTIAGLDHPNIVTVYDVSSTEDWPCFVVSKYIDGSTLAQRIKANRPSVAETAELVATVAEALRYAHRQGLVHRDIKPSNILLDKSGKPFVADFGLALREQDVGKGPRYAGTPAYMSPEQARGEGHRVDGRSDIFSLGVVFYELLVGRPPFRAQSQAELLEQVTNHEPRPLRQMDEGIPKELERICFKALSKRAAERYMTAQDMADDLKHFLTEQKTSRPVGGSPSPTPTVSVYPGSSTPSIVPAKTPTSDSQPLKIVPKGLRSFDAHDADFFHELLPGPRDRQGLPDSIRFWKTRIEETDTGNTFTVGLIYGPSGCGKSSLMKAGLLPRLSNNVIAVYVEATGEETETRLLYGLRKRCPSLPDHLGLKETLATLRRGQGIPLAKKVLIVIDQFEQWLHATKEEQNTELVQALRQCDGGRVQCIVMVRDDFWMAATRFMRDLEFRLLEGQNSAAVELFDLDHARKVLAAFGRAFGKLPENPSETGKDQKAFLNQAVSGLAQEGKVNSVRLALFSEMMKGKAWTPATLKEVGGTEGVGVAFLEWTFSAAAAPPEHRYHQKAAREVLKALLPESGTDIKGHMRSHADLLQASGYANRPTDFDDLIRILDSEIRLIMPNDPEGKEGTEESTSQAPPGQKYYQLTHDYLVPSLRDWLTRKQKETRRGRAGLLLADRAAVWNARPENRQLPSVWQWCSMRCLTRQKNWTPPQRKMMRRAGWYHALRAGAFALILLLFSAAFATFQVGSQKDALVQRVNKLADVMGDESAAALSFSDTAAAEEVLGALRQDPTVVFACTYDTSDKVMATYKTAGAKGDPPPLPGPEEPVFTPDGCLEVFHPVVKDKERLGTVYLRASMAEPDAQLHRYLVIVRGLAVSLFLVISLLLLLQLTHDYLVPSLRDWLTRKQKETRRGRAGLPADPAAAMRRVGRYNALRAGAFALILLLLSAAFATFQVGAQKDALVHRVAILAAVMGDESTAALSFNDTSAAREVLGALRQDPTVVFACTYDTSDRVMATYNTYKAAGAKGDPPPLPGPEEPVFTPDGCLEVFHPVVKDKERLGTVYLRASMAEPDAQLHRYLVIIVALGLAVSLFLVISLLRLLQ